jgi:hypothetical protein
MKREKIDGVVYVNSKMYNVGEQMTGIGAAILGTGLILLTFASSLTYQGKDETSHKAIREMKDLMDIAIAEKGMK